MKKKELSWESLVRKCPHCGVPLKIHHVSTINQKHLIGMIYKSLHNHYIKDCINHDSPKSIDMEIEIGTQLGSYAKSYEYKKNKLIV